MYYTREKHKRFLDKELEAISDEYLKKIKTAAVSLLSNHEIYVTQFVSLDFKDGPANDSAHNVLGSGQLILRFKKDKGIPRKNEYFTALVLDGDMCFAKKWGDITWGKLRSFQKEFSEIHCVWQGRTDDKGYLVCGFSGISIEMADYLIKNKLQGCAIILGPQEPPINYYQNLVQIVSNPDPNMPAAKILDFDKSGLEWNPTAINSDKSQIDPIIEQLTQTDELVFQGPPGTGKTHLMASLVSALIKQEKSVLVTAMTNRALIELAQKDSLKIHLQNGKVYKTNVSADEMLECKNIKPVSSSDVVCLPGVVTLSTFYNTSGWAISCYNEQPFDYVIMDEASQALLGMVAACKNLGKKVLWIGDQQQMQPIVMLSDESLIRNDYMMLANGFQTLCEHFHFKSYILNETHRLLPKSAALTSLFYPVDLKSVAKFDYELNNTQLDYIPVDGGTSFIFKSMLIGEKSDKDACDFTINIVSDLLKKQKDLKIAVLSKFRATVRMLQNYFISRFGSNNNVLIDTVERVQGMTCDICIYFIPNTMMGMSLNKALFNVATSRAKMLTLIICDKSLLNCNCDKVVQSYIQNIQQGTHNVADSRRECGIEPVSVVGSVGPKVVGFIDPSTFERKKKEISAVKENIYIIDTNVFVNYPDVISKIDKKYKVVLSAKVIDELDYLKIKLKPEEVRNVENALRNINRSLENPNVSMELSDMSLLPDDFDKRSPDNKILTVALKFKDENPILLTSDNGLQVKAKGLKISTVSLKEFLKR